MKALQVFGSDTTWARIQINMSTEMNVRLHILFDSKGEILKKTLT